VGEDSRWRDEVIPAVAISLILLIIGGLTWWGIHMHEHNVRAMRELTDEQFLKIYHSRHHFKGPALHAVIAEAMRRGLR
jgi:hypothetical protein